MENYNIVLFSGGFDSTCALLKLIHSGVTEITLLSVTGTYQLPGIIKQEKASRELIKGYINRTYPEVTLLESELKMDLPKSRYSSLGHAQYGMWMAALRLFAIGNFHQ